jgi:hypothetical protein
MVDSRPSLHQCVFTRPRPEPVEVAVETQLCPKDRRCDLES